MHEIFLSSLHWTSKMLYISCILCMAALEYLHAILFSETVCLPCVVESFFKRKFINKTDTIGNNVCVMHGT